LLAPSMPCPCRGGGGSPGGLHPASWGSAVALCLPHGLGVGAGWWRGEVRVSPPRPGILQFPFPVPAWLPAGLSGAPGGQPRAAAMGFLQSETCWMGGKSCRDCVFTTGLQDPNSLWHAPARGGLLPCLGVLGLGWLGASLRALGPAAELRGFALQPPLLAPFLPGQL